MRETLSGTLSLSTPSRSERPSVVTLWCKDGPIDLDRRGAAPDERRFGEPFQQRRAQRVPDQHHLAFQSRTFFGALVPPGGVPWIVGVRHFREMHLIPLAQPGLRSSR